MMYFYCCDQHEKDRQDPAGSPGRMGNIFYRPDIIIASGCERLFEFEHVLAITSPQLYFDGAVFILTSTTLHLSF